MLDQELQYSQSSALLSSSAGQTTSMCSSVPGIEEPGHRGQKPSLFSLDQCLECQSDRYWPLIIFATTKDLLISKGLSFEVVQGGCGFWRLMYSGLKYKRDGLEAATSLSFVCQKSITFLVTRDPIDIHTFFFIRTQL